MLVAFVIASLALAVLVQAASGALESSRTASRSTEALARARSRLALTTHGGALIPGDWRGDDGAGFRWHVQIVRLAQSTIRPLGAGTAGGPSATAVALYGVTVTESWQSGYGRREVQLQTEQLGAPAG